MVNKRGGDIKAVVGLGVQFKPYDLLGGVSTRSFRCYLRCRR